MVSIIITTWNKENSLPNTLHSISRQKTSFPYEVCITDDCSDVDPEPIVRQFIPNAKYKRLPQRVGMLHVQSECLDLVSQDSDIIIILQSDVIMTQDDIIEKLCKNVGKNKIVLSEVLDIPVSASLYKNFDTEVNDILSNWKSYEKVENMVIEDATYEVWTKCSGVGTSWLFYMGAILKDDLSRLIKFNAHNCDGIMTNEMKELGIGVDFLDTKGIHQRHIKVNHPCSIVDTCEIHCIRKIKK